MDYWQKIGFPKETICMKWKTLVSWENNKLGNFVIYPACVNQYNIIIFYLFYFIYFFAFKNCIIEKNE